MSYAMRAPAFFTTLNIANHDMIEYINRLAGEPGDAGSPLGAFLAANKLAGVITRDAIGRLQPEDQLPIAGDVCLRCHGPVGRLEAHSEPATPSFPFLHGQFWGTEFGELPAHQPTAFALESEGEIDGLTCDCCHRSNTNYKRASLFDGTALASANAGFFVDVTNPFGTSGLPSPIHGFQEKSAFCGTCHDATNPFVKTLTHVNGALPDMLHPMGRSYTEWYWSGYRGNANYQDCHTPMAFQGAQTWMLYPGMDRLWGNIDQPRVDAGYGVNASRRPALLAASIRNREFLGARAATLDVVDTVSPAVAGLPTTVKVTNLMGHKLPTGFAEARQMWIHIKAVDAGGAVVYEDGVLTADGSLARTADTKVCEQEILAEGYHFIDDNHFHFVLMNNIVKDNRIPPAGYNRAAYQRDGSFIIPGDARDSDYADGQWKSLWLKAPEPGVVP